MPQIREVEWSLDSKRIYFTTNSSLDFRNSGWAYWSINVNGTGLMLIEKKIKINEVKEKCLKKEDFVLKNHCLITLAIRTQTPLICDNLVEIDKEFLRREWPSFYMFSETIKYITSKEICAQVA